MCRVRRQPSRPREPAPCPPCSRRVCHDRDGTMSRSLVPRMVALVVVIVVGVYYIVFDVMQYRVTSQPFSVTVLMPGAGGLYSGADVTYRGVQVGTVSALNLHPGNVAVTLDVEAGQ